MEIHQYVKDEDTAWAQGRVQNPTASILKPGVNPNLYLLSIEHQGQDLSFAPEEYIAASAELVKNLALKWNFPIDRKHVIGHYEIFSGKPNCPALDKNIIDVIVRRAQKLVGTDVTSPKQEILKRISIMRNHLDDLQVMVEKS